MRHNELLRNTRWKSLNCLAIVAFGLATCVALPVGAEAKEARKKKDDTRTVYLVKYQVNGEVRYNKVGKGQVVKISAADNARAGSLVCTPSGFGQKSRCHSRGLF